MDFFVRKGGADDRDNREHAERRGKGTPIRGRVPRALALPPPAGVCSATATAVEGRGYAARSGIRLHQEALNGKR